MQVFFLEMYKSMDLNKETESNQILLLSSQLIPSIYTVSGNDVEACMHSTN